MKDISLLSAPRGLVSLMSTSWRKFPSCSLVRPSQGDSTQDWNPATPACQIDIFIKYVKKSQYIGNKSFNNSILAPVSWTAHSNNWLHIQINLYMGLWGIIALKHWSAIARALDIRAPDSKIVQKLLFSKTYVSWERDIDTKNRIK